MRRTTRTLLIAGIAAGIGFAAQPAAPAQAEPTGVDAAFLTALTGAGLSHQSTDDVAVSAGHAVCDLMASGMTAMDTVTAVQTTNPGFSLDHAARFAAISARTYCPQYL